MIGLGLRGIGVNRRPGASIWTPATLFAASEQGVWYDPSDFSTLFQDSAGTVPVTATGQVVGKMLDKSGRGNHASQATTASKPTLQQDGNGKYYLAFDGVDDGMATAAVNFTATDKVSIFAGVGKLADGANGKIVELGGNADSTNSTFQLEAPSNMAFSRYFGFSSRGTAIQYVFYTAAGGAAPTTVTLSCYASISEDVLVFRRNGVQIATSSGDQGSGNYANLPMYIGSRSGSTQRLNGRIYQLIVRGALTDAAGITAAETYVNTKTAAY